MSAEARRTSAEARANTVALLAAIDRARRPGWPARVALELGSGSGEHALALAARYAELTWQPSDPDPIQRASIEAWIAHAHAERVRPPLALDATRAPWPVPTPLAAVVAVHLLHLLPDDALPTLCAEAARCLAPGGLWVVHDAFLDADDRAESARMAEFHQRLRARDGRLGLPRRARLDRAALDAGLRLAVDAPYDGDQRTLVWTRA